MSEEGPFVREALSALAELAARAAQAPEADAERVGRLRQVVEERIRHSERVNWQDVVERMRANEAAAD
jgi:hypothetical protein